ncbi:hypothetical protein [Luteimonas sp. MC1825]|uniref:hypothetical protein n=1 Tax=Luteimonas sp. MC1825 TaxID=2761107 RepID=UPI00160DD267|nr:hypothetical protein [Luteimonas sp. MC1825]MBB6600327.1 hypothetical protein [Luteimonas sp. MC1825]QOC88005.1 hypothetical protein IDM46_12420 [Luteimonas sp. MC1825]
MSTRFLAFRAFGKFQWPPVGAGPHEQEREGVVEVHYVQVPNSLRYAACVRWVPRTLFTGGEPIPWVPFETPYAALESLHTISDLPARFAPENIAIAFRFGGHDTSVAKGVRLQFAGANVFDQYSAVASRPQGPPRLVLRMPLLAKFRRKGKDYRSTVKIGQPGNANCRFDVAVALRTPLDDDQANDEQAFAAFSALYGATRSAPNASEQNFGLELETLCFGAVSKEIASPTTVGEPSAILGQFTLSHSRAHGVQTWIDSAFWPTKKLLLDTVLPALGFDTKGASRSHFSTLDADNKPAALHGFPSLTIAATGGSAAGVPAFEITQRAALDALGEWTPDKGDIRVGVVRRGANDERLTVEVRSPAPTLGWMPFETVLHISTALSGRVDNVWAPGHTSVDVQSSVGGRQRLEDLDKTSALAPTSRDRAHTFARLLGSSLGGMALARVDLLHLQPAHPVSSLPELSAFRKRDEAFVALVTRSRCELGKLQGISSKREAYRLTLQDVSIKRLSLLPGLEFRCKARWPSLIDEHASGVKGDVAVSLRYDAGVLAQESFCFGFTIHEYQEAGAPPKRHRAAIGGFVFESAGAGEVPLLSTADEGRATYIRVRVRPPIMWQGTSLPTVEVQAKLTLSFDRVDVDGLDTERFAPSDSKGRLLIQEQQGVAGRYSLVLEETVQSTEERRLQATLQEQVESSTQDTSTVVLSTEPLAFFRAHMPPLEARGGQDTVHVAAYDSHRGTWQTRLVRPVYHYTLPPQSIGESMDKPSRLEIHDYTAPAAGEPAEFIRPMSPLETASSLPKRRAVEFRLTPPTELWVRPSDVERNFATPEWAAATLFRQRGELGLGVALEALRTEFLYGLSVSVEPARESGPARRARVAEIETLLGRPVAWKGVNTDDEYEDRWDAKMRAYRRRLERLELWADDPMSVIPFAPARFRESTRFALRTSALHRPAVAELDPPSAAVASPTQVIPALSPRLHSTGLRGGALWSFESRNVLNMLLLNPVSEGGTLEGIALGVLGGDADQTAAFCNRRVRIISETRGGFVQRLQVEVIGRIAVWWNRAKHVIVYERTCNPSAQFTPLEVLGDRTRRPVLRKVREYVELLQPERRYPDAPGAAGFHACFVRALRFNQKQIAVDSMWGEDLDDAGNANAAIGWIVPLWNRYAARVRPQVYARPDIVFVSAAEGASGEESPQECLNPENLYFFADTTPDATDDTDAWMTRLRIDYPNLPLPCHGWPSRPAGPSDAASTEPTSAADATPPGHARYTWRLAPPAIRTPVNEHRGEKPLYAAIETITFSRAGRPASAPPANSLASEALTTALNLKLVGALKLPLKADWDSPARADDPPEMRLARAALAAVKLPTSLPTDDQKQPIKDAMGALKTAFDVLRAQGGALEQSVAVHKDHQSGLISQELKDAYPLSDCNQLTKRLTAGFDAKRLALSQQLQAWDAKVADQLDRAVGDESFKPNFWMDRALFKAHIHELLEEELHSVFASTTIELGSARRGVEAIRSAIADVSTSLEVGLDRVRADVEALNLSIDRDKPWSAARRRDFEERVAVVVQRAQRALEAAIADGTARIAAEADPLTEYVGVIIGRALTEISSNESPVVARLDRAKEGVTRISTRLTQQSKVAEKVLSKVVAQLIAHRDATGNQTEKDACQALLDVAQPLQTDLTSLSAAWATIEQDLKQDATEFGQSVKLAAAHARQTTATAGQGLIDFIDSLEAHAATLPAPLLADIRASLEAVPVWISDTVSALLAETERATNWVDASLETMRRELWELAAAADGKLEKVCALLEDRLKVVTDGLSKAEGELSPDALTAHVLERIKGVVDPIIDAIDPAVFGASVLDVATAAELRSVSTKLLEQSLVLINQGSTLVSELASHVENACASITYRFESFSKETAAEFVNSFPNFAERFNEWMADADDVMQNVEKWRRLRDGFDSFDNDARKVVRQLVASGDMAARYGERVIDAVAGITNGGVLSVPGNILRALAAAGTPPELPNLEFAKERLAYYYGLVDGAVDTTPVEAWFGRLGDDLKAIGLSLPFDRIGNQLEPIDLSQFDIGRILRSCGGVKLDRLFKGCKLPQSATDAIRISHDFDRKNYRAWFQIEVDAPLEGRNALFSFGPFSLDAVNARAKAFLRVEASKNTEEVSRQARSSFETDFEMVVGGQVMVTLREVAVRYDDSGSLRVDFDPKKIELNSALQFVQNTLGSIIPDEVGGLKVLKQNGLPVGLEHVFSMPPTSLMFGTSGVQNIQISNHFQLIAYPDFLIANRFALSRPDLPFFFTIFIIGGTGWITVDVEYRPFGNGLLVEVDAGAGGSASIAFAFAGVTGSVAISISVALTYRKLIGQSGGGLTVSMCVLVVGVVDVLRIATAYITILLRLSYKDNGDIDARGSFSITIRISRFFKISAGGQARYAMTGGKKQTSSESNVDAEITDESLKKASKLIKGQGGTAP